jgi:hypothetical protein
MIINGILFREVKGLSGFFASQCGNIYSVKGAKILKQSNHSRGYMCIGVYDASTQKTRIRLVHRLVAAAWLGYDLHENSRYRVVDHINNDKKDNRVENLQITTQRNNATKNRTNVTGFPGVKIRGNRFEAQIRIKNELHHLGSYATPQEAHSRYKISVMLLEYHLK